jgi:hypothetical protein
MCIHPAGKLVVQVLGCWCKHDHETHLRKTRTAHRTAWGRTGCCTRGRTSHSCLLAAALMRRRRDCRVGCARALSGLPNQLIFCVTSARGLPYLLFVSNKWPLRPWSPRPKQPRDITRRNWWSPANTWVNTDRYKLSKCKAVLNPKRSSRWSSANYQMAVLCALSHVFDDWAESLWSIHVLNCSICSLFISRTQWMHSQFGLAGFVSAFCL